MSSTTPIREAFPELDEIGDDDLRRRVVRVWETAIADSAYDDVLSVPWWPPLEDRLERIDLSTVDHVRDVTDIALALADTVSNRGYEVDRDVVTVGALVHDISKCYELTGDGTNELHEWVPHPHYGVHVLAAAGFSPAIQHIALAHSGLSGVEPRSLEAQIVRRADQLAVDAVFWTDHGAIAG